MAHNESDIDVLRDYVENLLHHDDLPSQLFEKMEKRFGYKRNYFGVLAFILLSLYILLTSGGVVLVNIVGVMYPGYMSIIAVESDNKMDDTQWLTYWVVHAVFATIEIYTDVILSWCPFYFVMKLLFLWYCMCPLPCNGAERIYQTIIRPHFLEKHGFVSALIRCLINALAACFDAVEKTDISENVASAAQFIRRHSLSSEGSRKMKKTSRTPTPKPGISRSPTPLQNLLQSLSAQSRSESQNYNTDVSGNQRTSSVVSKSSYESNTANTRSTKSTRQSHE